ncbi:hypothetical protein D3C85_1116440 [compost metagenome]
MENTYNSKIFTLISIIVLVYSVAGGSFNGSVELFGATLIFSKPILVEYMTVFVMCFLLWRHVVSTLPILKGFRREVIKSTDISQLLNLYESLVRGALSERIEHLRSQNSPFENQQGWLNDIKVELEDANISSFDVAVSYTFDGEQQSKLFHVEMARDLSLYSSIQKRYAKAFLITIFIKPSFWDIYYPIVLSVSAFILYIDNYLKR